LEASGIIGVGSDLAVDFDESLHEDGGDFAFVQCVLKAISSISTQVENDNTVGRGSKGDIHVLYEAQERLYISNASHLTNQPLGAYLPESLDRSQWCGADNT